MKNLKNYLLAIVFSILGGLTSITGYKYFNDDINSVSVQANDNLKFANYVSVSYTHLTLPTIHLV